MCSKHCWIPVLIFFGFVGFILGIVGSVVYGIETHKKETYLESTCHVSDITYAASRCNKRRCYYTVYTVWYLSQKYENVTTFLEDSTRSFRSMNSAIENGYESYPPGTSSSCWYDPGDLKEVHWQEPDPLPGLVVMCIGWSLMGVCIIGCVCLAFGGKLFRLVWGQLSDL